MGTKKSNSKTLNLAKKYDSQITYSLGFALALLMMFRNTYWSWRTVWAEDGTIFFMQVRSMPFYEYMTVTYNGSYIFLTRLLFLPMEIIPIDYLSYYCGFISFLTYFLAIVIIDKSVKRHLSLKGRLYLAFGFALIPIAGAESLQNINNLPWFWVIGWAVYTCNEQTTTKTIHRILYRVFTILLSFSSPIMFLLVGFTIFFRRSLNYHAKNRNISGILFISSVAIAGLIQNLSAFKVRVHGIGDLNILLSVCDSLYRSIFIPILGISMYDHAQPNSSKSNISLLLTIVTSLAFALLSKLLWDQRKKWDGRLIVSFQIGLILYAVTFSGLFVQLADFSHYYFSFALAHARYFVTSSFALIYFLVIFFDRRKLNGLETKVRNIFIFVFIFSAVLNFSNNPSKFAPDFPNEVSSAKNQCLSQNIDTVEINVSPPNGEWKIMIPCDELLSR
jgi:hypothetical protein